MVNMTNVKESMVIYESAYKAINFLPETTMKWEAIEGLLEYGFYGIIPESENPFINMVYVQAIPSMRSAKDRYDKAVENGKKGGRPTEVTTEEIIKMRQSGMTNKQIAEKLGCSVKNIENRITIWNKNHKNDENNPNNPNNLSVSSSVSVSESVSLSESEMGIEEREIANANEEREEMPLREKEMTLEDELEKFDDNTLNIMKSRFSKGKTDKVNHGYLAIKKDYKIVNDLDKNFAKVINGILDKRETERRKEKERENLEFAMAQTASFSHLVGNVDYDEVWRKKREKEEAEKEAELAKLTPEQREKRKQREEELMKLW